jgi:hypothetical protein
MKIRILRSRLARAAVPLLVLIAVLVGVGPAVVGVLLRHDTAGPEPAAPALPTAPAPLMTDSVVEVDWTKPRTVNVKDFGPNSSGDPVLLPWPGAWAPDAPADTLNRRNGEEVV